MTTFTHIPQWDVSAELAEKSNENRPGTVRLNVNDGDLDAVFRSLRNSGYRHFTLNQDALEEPSAAA